MTLLTSIGYFILWPGNRVRRSLGITDEQDNGILRSMINMTVWGIFALGLGLMFIEI